MSEKFELTFALLDPPEWVKPGMIARIVLHDAEKRKVLAHQAQLGQRYPWKPGLWAFYWVRIRGGRRIPFATHLFAPNLSRRMPRRAVKELIQWYYPGTDPDSLFGLQLCADTVHFWSSLEIPEPNQIPW